MKKLLLLLSLISMQSQCMGITGFFNKWYDSYFAKVEPFPLLALPDDLVREILLLKVDHYISQSGDTDSKAKNYTEAIRICNIMARTCRKMRNIVNSPRFVKPMADRYEGVKNYAMHLCYSSLILELFERCKEESSEIAKLMNNSCMRNTLCLQLLLSKGVHPDVEYNGRFPLHIATHHKKTDAIKLLLANKASVDKQGPFQETALHIAVKNADYTAIRCLLDHGASLHIKNSTGSSPLKLAHKKYESALNDYKNAPSINHLQGGNPKKDECMRKKDECLALLNFLKRYNTRKNQ